MYILILKIQQLFHTALKDIDSIFLLRPPHISNIQEYISPLIRKIQAEGINEIVFLSLQGADKSRFIPHYKIEKLILEQGLDYIFLRPSYFMQNLTTTLMKDIQERKKIFLPAGKANFNWVDAFNVGELAAFLMMHLISIKIRLMKSLAMKIRILKRS